MDIDTTQRCASAKEMAERLGISINSLNKQRSVKPEEGPPFVKFGSRVLYPLHGIDGFDGWLAAQIQGGARG
jgi:hypothetical protein